MKPLDATQNPTRRHDLDALRSLAMLLGIVLHAGLAFAPFPLLAMNNETAPSIGTLIEVIHGFRLPIFFIMSGFFSAMLITKRGLTGFLSHRSKRILLPLIIGSLTIIPAMWGVIIGGHAVQRIFPAPQREQPAPTNTAVTIWSAAAAGDLDTVERLALSGTPIDEPDEQFSTLPLAWAATGDHDQVVDLLLKMGADPNQRMTDDNTPMHTACFFGASASAALMLEAGGNPDLPNRHGETPVDAMRHEAGVVAFIANLLGVEADFSRVKSGRLAIGEMLESHHDRPESEAGIREHAAGFLTREIFMHLWFLWHLCWLGFGLGVVSLAARLAPSIRIPEFIVSTPICLIGLLPLTALTQSWQASFGPDTSAALIPAPHVLLHYAVFFGFGAVVYNSARAADRLGHAWWVHLPIAAAACTLALRLVHDPSAYEAYGIGNRLSSWLTALLQSIFVWTLSLGLIGLSRSFLNKPSDRLRYLSDSSYWLYIAHLPIVLAGQFVMAYLPLPVWLEFGALIAVSSLVLIASYHWCVRYTWIGDLLNGRRRRS